MDTTLKQDKSHKIKCYTWILVKKVPETRKRGKKTSISKIKNADFTEKKSLQYSLCLHKHLLSSQSSAQAIIWLLWKLTGAVPVLLCPRCPPGPSLRTVLCSRHRTLGLSTKWTSNLARYLPHPLPQCPWWNHFYSVCTFWYFFL